MLPINFDIRLASVSDAPRVAPLFSAYREFYGQAPDIARAEQFLADRLAAGESTVFLAEAHDGRAPLGFAQLYSSFSSVRCRPVWILNDLFVVREARSSGVGRALIDAIATTAKERELAYVMLSTAHDNLTAQALYERSGFVLDTAFRTYELEIRRESAVASPAGRTGADPE